MAEWCASSTPDGSGASGTGAADAVGVAGAATAMPDESNGPAGEAPAAGPGTAGVGAAGEVIPVIEERVRVGKRAVERGTLRVRSHVVEHPVQARVRLREERLRVDRPADAAEEKAFRERVVEVSAIGEEAVSRREARVVEEVEIRKEATERVQIVNDTARRTEVVVEGDGGPEPAEADLLVGRGSPPER